jgi:hypothetical protein
MSFLDPVLRPLGWRAATLISPHPPEDCSRRLKAVVANPLSWSLPASGVIGKRSASLIWNDGDWAGFGRVRVFMMMGEPVMRVRFEAQGPGARLECQSGITWVVVCLWALCLSFFLFLNFGEGQGFTAATLKAGLIAFLGISAFFGLCIALGHRSAREVESKLVGYIAQATDAELA